MPLALQVLWGYKFTHKPLSIQSVTENWSIFLTDMIKKKKDG